MASASDSPVSAASAPGQDDAASTLSPKPKIKPNLTGVSETMLIVLACRAEDANRGHASFLHDTVAADTLAQLDWTRRRTIADTGFAAAIMLRARLLDAWTTEFLAANPAATVLHLGCGLDSRALRVAWGKAVRWFDVDVPAVVALRRQVMPEPGVGHGEYTLLESSVTEMEWLNRIPADKPTLVVMEGLLMYLQPGDAKALVGRMVERFPSGQLLFDIPGAWFLRLQSINRPIKKTGARMYFGLDDEHELEAVNPKLKVRSALRFWQLDGLELMPWYIRLSMWVYSWIPGLKTMISYMRYDF